MKSLPRKTLFEKHSSAGVARRKWRSATTKTSRFASCSFFTTIRRFWAGPESILKTFSSTSRSAGAASAAALLRYVAKLAHERQCGRLEWSVLDWNEPAIKFYKKLGAVPMREWTVFRVTGEALAKLAAGAAEF